MRAHAELALAAQLAPTHSATVSPWSAAAWRSMWSEPMPAVSSSFSFFAFSMRSRVMYAGWNGVVMMMVASSRFRSSSEYQHRVN